MVNRRRIILSSFIMPESYFPSEFCMLLWASFVPCREQRRILFSVSHLEKSRNTFSRSTNFSPLQLVCSMFQQYLYSRKDCEPGIKKFMHSGKQSVGASEYIMEHIPSMFRVFYLSILHQWFLWSFQVFSFRCWISSMGIFTMTSWKEHGRFLEKKLTFRTSYLRENSLLFQIYV